MMKVLVADSVSQGAMDLLKKSGIDVVYEEVSPEALLKRIPEFEGLMVRSRTKVTKQVIEAGKNLKVIGRAGIGVDNIDMPTATAKKIAVVNAPRASTISVAEFAFLHMLNMARGLSAADASMKKGEWAKKKFKGNELYGKTLGFIGCGRIGYEVGMRAKAFGMKMVAYDPYITQQVLDPASIKLTDLDTVLKESDFITIHALLTNETRGMVNAAAIKKMKKTAFIINCARGGIIDEKALKEALDSGNLAGASLDVFENEPPTGSQLVTHPKVCASPHIAASTKEAQDVAGVTTAEQMIKFMNGDKPEFIVNKEILK